MITLNLTPQEVRWLYSFYQRARRGNQPITFNKAEMRQIDDLGAKLDEAAHRAIDAVKAF